MNIDGANEADVREDIASPLLAQLGYRRGSENDIRREVHLTYNKQFLGRKKKGDPPLAGRADYMLVVTGAARWVLETKAPTEEITRDAIEQTISYARHPEVSGAYAVILNGRRIVGFHQSQNSTDEPLIDLEVTTVADLATRLSGVLSPIAIRRDCSPKRVDLALPLTDGLRSTAEIVGGEIVFTAFVWHSDSPWIELVGPQLNEICERMRGFRTNILGGIVFRDEHSRIRAKLNWGVPHDDLLKFIQNKKLLEVEYVSLSSTISSDPELPTVFDVAGNIHIDRDEQLFDIMRWRSAELGYQCSMSYRGQSTGFINEGRFVGSMYSDYEISFPEIPDLVVDLSAVGTLEIVLDRR